MIHLKTTLLKFLIIIAAFFIFSGCNSEPKPQQQQIVIKEDCTIPELPIYSLPKIKTMNIYSNMTIEDKKELSKNFKQLRLICKKYQKIITTINRTYSHKKELRKF